MNNTAKFDKQWHGVSIVDIIIYTVLSSIFNFIIFYFQSELVIDSIKWNFLIISTLLWIIGCVVTRISYLYANNK
jgi:hypothetical protein